MSKLVRGSRLIVAIGSMSMLGACVAFGSRSSTGNHDTSSGSRTDEATVASPAPESKALQVSDLPIPKDARIDESGSLVIGSGDRWLGRVVMRVRAGSAETYNLFFNGMPQLGWTPYSAVQSKVSLLTFARGDRFATVQIEGGVAGATVTILVATRSPETR
ncbi:MAG: hypothetical protein ACKO42_06690 [Gammaproteobacteria bacterium]